jgi:lipoate synthase
MTSLFDKHSAALTDANGAKALEVLVPEMAAKVKELQVAAAEAHAVAQGMPDLIKHAQELAASVDRLKAALEKLKKLDQLIPDMVTKAGAMAEPARHLHAFEAKLPDMAGDMKKAGVA